MGNGAADTAMFSKVWLAQPSGLCLFGLQPSIRLGLRVSSIKTSSTTTYFPKAPAENQQVFKKMPTRKHGFDDIDPSRPSKHIRLHIRYNFACPQRACFSCLGELLTRFARNMFHQGSEILGRCYFRRRVTPPVKPAHGSEGPKTRSRIFSATRGWIACNPTPSVWRTRDTPKSVYSKGC